MTTTTKIAPRKLTVQLRKDIADSLVAHAVAKMLEPDSAFSTAFTGMEQLAKDARTALFDERVVAIMDKPPFSKHIFTFYLVFQPAYLSEAKYSATDMGREIYDCFYSAGKTRINVLFPGTKFGLASSLIPVSSFATRAAEFWEAEPEATWIRDVWEPGLRTFSSAMVSEMNTAAKACQLLYDVLKSVRTVESLLAAYPEFATFIPKGTGGDNAPSTALAISQHDVTQAISTIK